MHLLNFYHKVSLILERVHKNMVNGVDVFKLARKNMEVINKYVLMTLVY
ncbi:hypothetical protein GCM10007931_29270 [Vibrio algivorus]|uniref:Uncharacterized protein n=1 Tax=Vibrio algivorus TaxID=1667024 RepID=A0ABQ6ES02_9VIBR|nr:hypothetical protein GCM10007931_29270 [Vibrio algivorus]